MRSVFGSARSPRAATSPLTRTRPSAISASEARRLPNPARARIFCSRSSSGPVTGRGGLRVRAVELRQRVAQGLGGRTEPVLELLHHVGPGAEVADGGQRVEAGEPQLQDGRA